jgi:ERCC4-related helicase
MNEQEIGFRVVGLSATPGSENEKIQEVVYNLNIKRIIYKDD